MVPLSNKRTLQGQNNSWWPNVLLGKAFVFWSATKVGHQDARWWLWNCLQNREGNVVAIALSIKVKNIEVLLCVISILEAHYVEEAKIEWQ